MKDSAESERDAGPNDPDRAPAAAPRDEMPRGLVLLLVMGLVAGAFAWLGSRGHRAGGGQPVRAIEAKLAGRLGTTRAHEVLGGCVAQASCECAGTVAKTALDAAPAEVKAYLGTVGSCPSQPLDAMQAEADARLGEWKKARRDAEAIVQREPMSTYALEALAYSYFVEGDARRALEGALRAETTGRGAAAPLLAGLAALKIGDLETAAAAFSRGLKLESEDTDLNYNFGLTMQRRGRYLEPREAYLKTLRVRPDYHEARYNLCVLLHSYGAIAEARHHLEKLASMTPNAPNVAELRALLATPPPRNVTALPARVPAQAPAKSDAPPRR